MIDISLKKETMRYACARGEVWLPEKISKVFKNGDIQTKKGAVFQTAIIAGTMAVKQTDRLIPFCHSLPIESIDFSINFNGECVVILCKVRTSAKTGVEMEALLGVQIAALTVYDMCKSFGQEIKIKNCQLIEKRGGKSDYQY